MDQYVLVDIIELVLGWLWAVICQCCQIIIYAEIVWGSRCSGVMQCWSAELTELGLIIQNSIYTAAHQHTTPGTLRQLTVQMKYFVLKVLPSHHLFWCWSVEWTLINHLT